MKLNIFVYLSELPHIWIAHLLEFDMVTQGRKFDSWHSVANTPLTLLRSLFKEEYQNILPNDRESFLYKTYKSAPQDIVARAFNLEPNTYRIETNIDLSTM